MKQNIDHIDTALLVKYLLEETTSVEDREVEHWLTARLSNRQYFEQFKKVWEDSARLAAVSTVDPEDAWERWKQGLDKQERVVPVQHPYAWWKIAAVLVLMAGAIAIGLVVYQAASPQVTRIAMEGVETDTLPDGSVATLNTGAVLRYPEKWKGQSRQLELQGEAFFEVVPEKAQPFIVNVGDISVQVLGTSFNIKEEKGQTTIVVETGAVQVQKGDRLVILREKEKLVVHKQDSSLSKEAVTGQLYNFYKTGTIVCNKTPLWELVALLNEYYGIDIIIDNPALRELPLTATFKEDTPEHILDIVSETLHIEIGRSAGQIHLK